MVKTVQMIEREKMTGPRPGDVVTERRAYREDGGGLNRPAADVVRWVLREFDHLYLRRDSA